MNTCSVNVHNYMGGLLSSQRTEEWKICGRFLILVIVMCIVCLFYMNLYEYLFMYRIITSTLLLIYSTFRIFSVLSILLFICYY